MLGIVGSVPVLARGVWRIGRWRPMPSLPSRRMSVVQLRRSPLRLGTFPVPRGGRFRAFHADPDAVSAAVLEVDRPAPPRHLLPFVQGETLPSPLAVVRDGLGRCLPLGPQASGGLSCMVGLAASPARGNSVGSLAGQVGPSVALPVGPARPLARLGPMEAAPLLGFQPGARPSSASFTSRAPPPPADPSLLPYSSPPPPGLMAHEADDGGPRPKRRAAERDDPCGSKGRHPSPAASQREAELRAAALKGKAAAMEGASHRRDPRARDRSHSPDHWRGRERRS